MSGTYIFDVALFRIQFPAFANVEQFPDETLQMYWDSGNCIIANSAYGCLTGECRIRCLYLITAHLAALSLMIANKVPNSTQVQVPGLIQSATIDKITVSLTPPPLDNQFQWWLSLTPYGQQLFAILQVSSVGGFYIGSLPERAAFRSVFGIFP